MVPSSFLQDIVLHIECFEFRSPIRDKIGAAPKTRTDLRLDTSEPNFESLVFCPPPETAYACNQTDGPWLGPISGSRVGSLSIVTAR